LSIFVFWFLKMYRLHCPWAPAHWQCPHPTILEHLCLQKISIIFYTLLHFREI
jgi:hypothetical protein